MRSLNIPPAIETAMAGGAALYISISGGKDSQALLVTLKGEYQRRGWQGPLVAIHAHLGRMEWPQSLPHCQRICDAMHIPLVIVERPQGDLLQEIKDRRTKLEGTGKPFWPSAPNRYCTADQKRSQIDRVLRAPFWPPAPNRYCTSHHKQNQIDKSLRDHKVVISAEGIRAAESPKRAKKVEVSIRAQITATALRGLSPEDALAYRSFQQRVALTWYPLLDWSEADVWQACGTSLEELDQRRAMYQSGQKDAALEGWVGHPAYVLGNQRVSCALCVLANRSDLENGARHNPALYQELLALEQQTGCTFKADLALADLI